MTAAAAATSALGKATGKDGRNETINQQVKPMAWTSSLSEKPRSHKPRRLAEWLNPTGAKKVHSLCDKIYKPKNLVMAWERVKANRGAGGVDGQSVEAFERQLQEQLERLHRELRDDTYQPQPVRQHVIPKAGQPGKHRALGIPTVYDRVCQQAVLNRLEPIFEPVFDEASFGYRKGRSAREALSKIWREIQQGREWIVDADLRDFFGSADHDKLMTLLNQRIADGRVLGWIERMLKAGCVAEGQRRVTPRGVPQGGVASPLLSNILLTPFDREMRSRGYRLTRYADDWVVTCHSRAEAQAALASATRILQELGVTLHAEKTRIVHIQHGFEFLGYKIKRGSRPMKLAPSQMRSGARQGQLYAYPRHKSIQHFKEQIRQRTRRKTPLSTPAVIAEINPVIRGWGNYFCKAHVRKLFNRLDRWVRCRLRSHRCKHWRNAGWKQLPTAKLYGEYRLVSLVRLIPSLASPQGGTFAKAGCGKTARPV